ncbi:F-box protein [Paramyrothecium foliicola]|nr:F-box protein [Paramyrothecium foliicola]
MADKICTYHGRIAHPPQEVSAADGQGLDSRPDQGRIVASSKLHPVETTETRDLVASHELSNDSSPTTCFLWLPPEMQIHIIEQVDLDTLLAFRLVSKECHSLVVKFDGTLAGIMLRRHIPEFVAKLHPAPSSGLTLGYVSGVWARLHTARRVALRMVRVLVAAEYDDVIWPPPAISAYVFGPEAMKEPRPEADVLSLRRSCAMRHLVPRLFVFFHFLETFRKRQLQRSRSPDPQTLPQDVDDIAYDVMDVYSDQELKKTHEIISTFFDMTLDIMTPIEPVAVAARPSRGNRVWHSDLDPKPSEETLCALFCIGGPCAVRQLWELDGFARRSFAARRWHRNLPHMTGPIGIEAVFREDALRGNPGGAPRVPDGRVVSSLPPSSMAIPTKSYLSPDDVRHLLRNMPTPEELWTEMAEELLEERGMSRGYYFTTHQAWAAISQPPDSGPPMLWDLQPSAEFWDPSPPDFCDDEWFVS